MQIKEFEDKFLAPYAMKSCQSRGRVYKETEHPYRSAYQRDRDRIIHSAAFRRLEYKTQVFVNHEGDYYRTRLTHTLEVSQIARTIASAFKLNTDLIEALSLAHDLGHTPFGHSGEEALNELMQGSGGFNHNIQGLRVVDILEERYPGFPGLNLTWEVREGIVRHSSSFDQAGCVAEFSLGDTPILETQVVDIADEVAYDNHDLDDGLTSGLIKERDLMEVPLWNKIYLEINNEFEGISEEKRKYQIIRRLIDMQVTDLIEESSTKLTKLNPNSYKDIRKQKDKIISFSQKMQELRAPLREFILNNLYRHYRVIRMANKAKRFIGDLFNVYLNNPEQLPTTFKEKLNNDNARRIICDYIAGMTDRYALDEYKKLFDPYEKV